MPIGLRRIGALLVIGIVCAIVLVVVAERLERSWLPRVSAVASVVLVVGSLLRDFPRDRWSGKFLAVLTVLLLVNVVAVTALLSVEGWRPTWTIILAFAETVLLERGLTSHGFA